jgi:septum formation topological specificity factor MinE
MEIIIKIIPKKEKLKIDGIEVLKKELLELTSEYINQEADIKLFFKDENTKKIIWGK